MYPCESFARGILPIFKGLVAKELIEKYSFTQLEAAEKLGITQASISYYLHAKRGRRDSVEIEGIMPTIQVAASETAKNIATGNMSSEELGQTFCNICEALRREKPIRITVPRKSSKYSFLGYGI